MADGKHAPLIVRNAEEWDLPALVAIRPPEALHRGRLRDARSPDFRYLIFLRGQAAIGFSSLVFRRPPSWANADDEQHLPQISDLYIVEAERGQGYGSEGIRAMEGMTLAAGYKSLYLTVEPRDNPRAYTLYQRLGYRQLQSEPYFHAWASKDGDGELQRGELWLVDMVKPL